MIRRIPTKRLAASVFAVGLLLAACGSDDKDSTTTTTQTTTAPSTGDSSSPSSSTASSTAPSTTADTPSSSSEPAADVKPLVIAVSTEPSTLDAQLVNDRSSRVVTSSMYEALLFRSAEGEIVPLLATEYEATSDTTWSFTLRDDVTFHNGEPFNAEAAAFSINRIISEEFGTQRTSYTDGIVEATATDEFTVEVETDGILATLPVQLTQIPMVPPGAADTLDTDPVGTGPYKFVEWAPGVEIVATRNDAYWGEAPAIKDYIVRVVADNQTALSALQSGEVDLVIDLLPEQMDQAPVALSVPASEFSYIAFNTYLPALSDPRVRVAFNLAIDKDLLAETVYEGQARPNEAQHLAEGMLGFNPDLGPFPYDPEGAKALLDEAGFDYNTEITLNVPIGRYLKGEETAEFVAAQLEEIGVKIKVNAIEFATFREEGRIPGDEPGAMDLKYAWNSNEFGDGSRIIAHIICGGSSSKICIPEVDELMEAAGSTVDQDARDADYQEVWAILHENPHSIYLLQQNLIYGTTERLTWEPRVDDEYYVATMALTS
ncbi:MAG TPA: ABC transporter substrate-binding protein [Ilumatobacteraceae bacterium]|nr:ABC transporter substrate-binding protein [Ilumatobacteraceae bacterium]